MQTAAGDSDAESDDEETSAASCGTYSDSGDCPAGDLPSDAESGAGEEAYETDDADDAGMGDDTDEADDADKADEHNADAAKSKGGKLLSDEDVQRAQKVERKSGVVYMSRVPPFMRPGKVRHMLEKYAQIGRIYLIEEEDKRRKRRIKSGGNRRRQYVEGWIEFKNKKYAKAVARMLNNTNMGGKKHGFYHDDLWNLKYLPKFKWRHLVEQLASEKAAKEQRLQTEISQSRRELDAYMKSVDKAKKLSSIKARRQARAEGGQEVKPMADRSRNVWQRDVVVRDAAAAPDQDHSSGKRRRTTQQDDAPMSSILGKIF
ncbi:RNA-binding ATPase activator esf2 [Coemansia nantahalensis]|uniref:RNA-binding ATPase activator esf2 n=1 Tax=Coemansia nantahalensis TaxID=2789366 RepID=A0ACC1JNX2_9FUNG|nr:RNA-binding ATPase activator esf2 [Coemansia nantahalensis]